MDWHLEEALSYYRSQGAPAEQTALVALLREIQEHHGGSIPSYTLKTVAKAYGTKEGMLLLLIKRFPSLRLQDVHELILCAGPNCGKHTALASQAEALASRSGGKIVVKYGQCMRMCGKGPNLKWDGKLYHQATPELLKKLAEEPF